METIVVAGATGYLGRHVVVELAQRGYKVRAIVRSRTRAQHPGPYGSPAIGGAVHEWREGEVTDPGFIEGICEGGDRVISALGVTRQRASPWDIDYLANLRLLQDAERQSLRSFLYVNAMNADAGTTLYMRAKSAFRECLERSLMTSQVINPSGYFSDATAFLSMAWRGVALLPPDEHVQIAPIHGADLATYIVDHMGHESGSWDVGGPENFTSPEIATMAFEAVGKPPRMVTVPSRAVTASVWLASRVSRRAGDFAQFLAELLTTSSVAENFGTRHLSDYFHELASPE